MTNATTRYLPLKYFTGRFSYNWNVTGLKVIATFEGFENCTGTTIEAPAASPLFATVV